MIKVIIADDHAVVRNGVQMIFDTTTDIEITGEAKNGEELLVLLQKNSYDVVILDLTMPGKDGIDILSEIKKIYPVLPIIVFSMNNEDLYAVRVLRIGASAYLNKESDPSVLIEAVRTVYRKVRFITQRQMDLLLNSDEHSLGKLHEQLTDREFQIMGLIAQGIKKDLIAQKLEISKNTVDNHRKNILTKLKLVSNSELTKYAIENQLI